MSADMTQDCHAESPLPLWERDRVRGLARQREDISGRQRRENARVDAPYPNSSGACRQRIHWRLPAPDPSPCPSPARGEGTLSIRRASSREICESRRALAGVTTKGWL